MQTMLVTDFFVLWPLYHHTLTAKKPKKTIAEYNTFLKGTSGETLRKLVKSFGMEGGGFRISHPYGGMSVLKIIIRFLLVT